MKALHQALDWLIGLLCGRHHEALSRVFTINRRTKVCLRRRFECSWQTMGVISPQPRPCYVVSEVDDDSSGNP